jgi:chromosome segregation ATPase
MNSQFRYTTAFTWASLKHALIITHVACAVLQELREANEALRRQLDEKDGRITSLEDAAEEAAAAAAQAAEQQRQAWEQQRQQHRQQLQAQQEQVGGWGDCWC